MADPAPFTPEQQQILDRARILRTAREQREADDAAETNAAAGVTDAVPYAPAKEFARSTGEGAVSLADLPERAWTGFKNFPARMINAGVSPEGVPIPGVDGRSLSTGTGWGTEAIRASGAFAAASWELASEVSSRVLTLTRFVSAPSLPA
jgi:hypothetical protein